MLAQPGGDRAQDQCNKPVSSMHNQTGGAVRALYFIVMIVAINVFNI